MYVHPIVHYKQMCSASSSGFPENLIAVCIVPVVWVVTVDELDGLEVLGQLVLAVLHLPYLFYAMHANIIICVSNLSFLFLLMFDLECERSYKLKLLSIPESPFLLLSSQMSSHVM